MYTFLWSDKCLSKITLFLCCKFFVSLRLITHCYLFISDEPAAQNATQDGTDTYLVTSTPDSINGNHIYGLLNLSLLPLVPITVLIHFTTGSHVFLEACINFFIYTFVIFMLFRPMIICDALCSASVLELLCCALYISTR